MAVGYGSPQNGQKIQDNVHKKLRRERGGGEGTRGKGNENRCKLDNEETKPYAPEEGGASFHDNDRYGAL